MHWKRFLLFKRSEPLENMLKRLMIASLLLSGCAVYKIDVQQGTLITQTMLDQLEYGLPKRKVRFILGSPAIEDVFHRNRWDYIYTLQQRDGKREQRHIALLFEDDQLVKIIGDIKVIRNKPEAGD